jgi:hypothetical protein
MPPSVDPKVLAVADRVLARNAALSPLFGRSLWPSWTASLRRLFAATSAATCRRAAMPRRVRRRPGRPSITRGPDRGVLSNKDLTTLIKWKLGPRGGASQYSNVEARRAA